MLRALHRWAGLAAAIVLIVVSLTGVALSVFPALEGSGGGAPSDLATLVSHAETAMPGLSQIERKPGGQVIATAFGPNGFQRSRLDPATGAVIGPYAPSRIETWLVNLHRALFLDNPGRLIVLAAAVAMALLIFSGYAVAARRMGGWRALFGTVRNRSANAWHLRIARVAGIGLIVSVLTGLTMGAATFNLVPVTDPMPAFPAQVASGTPLPPATIPSLRTIPTSDLVKISLPRQGDPNGLYQIETQAGAGYIDPVSGQLEGWAPRGTLSKIMGWVRMIHTGQGAAWLGLLLGLCALAVPVLSGTGLVAWLKGRSSRQKGSASARDAEIILLVGSESGTTWRFAEAAARALRMAGKSVHLGEMHNFDPSRYLAAEAILLFAATSGDGDAPEDARGFLGRLRALPRPPSAPLGLLGFGDSSYPNYCGFAAKIVDAARDLRWKMLLTPGGVDRQSERDAADWVKAMGHALGLELHFALAPPRTRTLRLISRRDYGTDMQAPTSILRFALPRRSLADRLRGRGFAGFQAGDLLMIHPDGAGSRPRSYSLASSARDGFVEICVRSQPGGLVSPWLTSLEPGAQVRASLAPNPRFRVASDDAPLILIGAGAGVGALAGFVRGNRRKRDVHLYMGFRAREREMPYHDDLARWQSEGKLTRLMTASSRSRPGRYVQHLLIEDAEQVAHLIAQGARVMICGGRDMAHGVGHALAEALAPLGLDPNQLRQEGRYVEDVF
ncbi:PepSY domain-containing protein [Thioclava atlantica]|uniref:Bifunctional P-450:NADPH-P450 reductase n=1 Tax=Thioclava atlantica TaxID=1317124 RepID=A0A085TWM3_9RHOB|nr:PepSY domain-containing protein [Thioclava atlantica]KFE35120.1 bifunctional P-450:NADPH-P450 reductase [Thioclava atlantica]